jgi:transposase InsO family protein
VTEVYAAITKLHELGHPVSLVCLVLKVSRSAYYQAQQGIVSEHHLEDKRLKPMIRKIFWKHKRRLGARRISETLAAAGEACGRLRAGRLMREMGLHAIQPKSFRPKTTESRHRLGYSPNLLKNAETPTGMNQVWVCDITYIPLATYTFAYAALVMDRFSRRIVGWKIEAHMQEPLVLAALRMAIRLRQPKLGTLHHSDRGGQYAGSLYREVLGRAAMVQSMSRAANCYDNAFMESCFGTVKTELEMTRYANLQIACKEITAYIRYYNNSRIHSSLSYLTPNAFERDAISKVTR